MHDVIIEIKNRMHAQGLTEADLATRSGVSPLTVQRVLSGETASPGLQTVADLARVLGLSVTLSAPGSHARDAEKCACRELLDSTVNNYERMLADAGGAVRLWRRISFILFGLLVLFMLWYVLYVRFNILELIR